MNRLPLPLIVRPMEPSERVMVLANWKAELHHMMRAHIVDWATKRDRDFWYLVNYVLERITLPSCAVYVGVHPESVGTPMCWAAVRDGELLFSYYRRSVMKDAELADMLRDTFLVSLPVVAIHVRDFNPFMELEYAKSSD